MMLHAIRDVKNALNCSVEKKDSYNATQRI